MADARLIFAPLSIVVLLVGLVGVIPASAQDAGECATQPTPYDVELSVTPAQVEVGEEVGLSVSATDATGAPVECALAEIRLGGGGIKPARVSPRLQSGPPDLDFLLHILLGVDPNERYFRVQEPGDYQSQACVPHPDGTESCSEVTSLTAICDVYGTEGDDFLNYSSLDLRSAGTSSVCSLGGNDTVALQDHLDDHDLTLPPLNIATGAGDDLLVVQHVAGAGTDTRPFPYSFFGGGGDDVTGAGSFQDLQPFPGYRTPMVAGDWSYPGIWPAGVEPGNDTIRLPILGGIGEGGPGNDEIVGGAKGPNELAGQWRFAHGFAFVSDTPAGQARVAEGYLHLLLDDVDTITGGSRADLVEGGSDDDTIKLGNGTDRGVGDVILLPDGRIPFGSFIRFGADLINAGDNNDDDSAESILGEISPCCVIARVSGAFQGDVPPVDGGDDTLIGGGGPQKLDGQSGNDKLTGGAGNDKLVGGAGNDVLKGSAGSDVLTAGAGRDVLDGGGGNDRCAGGAGQDKQSGC